MEVILLEKVVNLGNLGDRVNVKAGYGRNYLLPKKMAVMATADNVAKFEARRAELEQAAAKALEDAQARAAQIAALGSVTIARVAGEEGKLFGSVNSNDVADAIVAAGVAVKKAEVKMPLGSIRHTGEFDIDLQLHTDVVQAIKVQVVAEK